MIDRVKRPAAGCLACVACLALVVALAYRVGPFERLDAGVLRRLSAHRDSLVGGAAGIFVHLGDPLPQLVLLALACGLALLLLRPEYAACAVVLVVGANATTQILKMVLAHSRYQPIFGYHQIGSTSFPSGHATAAMAMALAFALVVPRSWRPAVLVAGACAVAAVSCSVVILRRHYPSDVIGGWLIAGGWCFAVVAGLRLVQCRRAATPARPVEEPS